MKSRKIIREISDLAKDLSEVERRRAETIYEIHSKIYNDTELEMSEKRLLAKMFDKYVKSLEENRPEHNSEEIRRFEEFIKIYKEYRNHDWARFAISNVGKRITLPEHIDTLRSIVKATSALEHEHQIKVWNGLYKMANRSTEPEFHPNLLAFNKALEKYGETGDKKYIRMIYKNPVELHRHFFDARR